MHPPDVRADALKLVAAGCNDCEVSRITGIPRATVRDWRQPTYQRKTPEAHCHRCWGSARPMRFTPADYAELLAMYLGDGSISKHPRTERLRIVLDRKYPGIITETRELLERCFPQNRIDEVAAPGCVHVSLYCSHLSCLLPQHARGRKHERCIALEAWQLETVESESWPFIRGCIRTDGCVSINRTNVHREQPYEYLSYGFSNMSDDIVHLFVEACGRVGVFTRVTRASNGLWRVRINRRDSVARMLEHVGKKE